MADWTCRWWEQTTTVIPDSGDGLGSQLLGISKQISPSTPNTSEGMSEKVIVMEHHLMVLSLLQEHTLPAAATAKHAGQ